MKKKLKPRPRPISLPNYRISDPLSKRTIVISGFPELVTLRQFYGKSSMSSLAHVSFSNLCQLLAAVNKFSLLTAVSLLSLTMKCVSIPLRSPLSFSNKYSNPSVPRLLNHKLQHAIQSHRRESLFPCLTAALLKDRKIVIGTPTTLKFEVIVSYLLGICVEKQKKKGT